LNHPNIVTVYDIGRSEHGFFMVTEYIDGMTLRQRLNEEHLELGEVLEVAIQVASACGNHRR